MAGYGAWPDRIRRQRSDWRNRHAVEREFPIVDLGRQLQSLVCRVGGDGQLAIGLDQGLQVCQHTVPVGRHVQCRTAGGKTRSAVRIDFDRQGGGDLGQVVAGHGLIAVAVIANLDYHHIAGGDRQSGQINGARQVCIGAACTNAAQACRGNCIAIAGVNHFHRYRQVICTCGQGQEVVGPDRPHGIVLAIDRDGVDLGRQNRTTKGDQILLRMGCIWRLLQHSAIAGETGSLGNAGAIDRKRRQTVFADQVQIARTGRCCNVLAGIDLGRKPVEHTDPGIADRLTDRGGGVVAAIALDGCGQAGSNIRQGCGRACRGVTESRGAGAAAYHHCIDRAVAYFQAGDVKRPAFQAGVSQGDAASAGDDGIAAKGHRMGGGLGWQSHRSATEGSAKAACNRSLQSGGNV